MYCHGRAYFRSLEYEMGEGRVGWQWYLSVCTLTLRLYFEREGERRAEGREGERKG